MMALRGRLAADIVASVLAGVGALSAQTSQTSQSAQQAPTFKSTTSLVLVDVSVLDKDGRPVDGLTADDFEVKLDGKVRPVRAVTFERAAAASQPAGVVPAAPGASQTRGVTNVAHADTQRRIVVILVDDLSLSPSRGKSMLFSAARFLKSLPDTDIVGFATTSGDEAMNPTFDHAAIAAGLRHVVGEFMDPREIPGPIVSLEEAVAIEDGDNQSLVTAVVRDCFAGTPPKPSAGQLYPPGACPDDVERKARELGPLAVSTTKHQFASYQQVIEAMKTSPGLKQLVIISDGVAMSHRSDAGLSLFEPLAKAAAASGVQVTVLNEEPLGSDVSLMDPTRGGEANYGAGGGNVVQAQVARNDNLYLRAGIETVADVTGGAFYHVIGLADPFFARIALSSSALYQLGVDPGSDTGSGRDYALSVKVKRNGLTVLANRHAVAPAPPTKVPADQQIRAALGSGTPFYDVPVAMGSAVRRGASANEMALDLNVAVPGSVRGPLQVSFAIGNTTGFVKSGRTTLAAPTAAGDYRASVAIPVPPGTYRVRFAVADADGHVGSVQAGVAASLNKIGPLLASDLLTGWTGADNKPQFLALENVPTNATRLLASLELYSATADPLPPDLSVLYELVNADDATVAKQAGTLSSVSGALHADAQFALAALPVGSYTLKATISSGGKALGVVTTSLHTSGPAGPPN